MESVHAVDFEMAQQLFEQCRGHGGVVDDAHGRTAPTVADSLGHLLRQSGVEVVVDLHLGVASELEAVGGILVVIGAGKEQGQAVAHHIVDVHEAHGAVVGGKTQEATHPVHGQLDDGVVAVVALPQGHRQVDAAVAIVVEVLGGLEPLRVYEPGEGAPVVALYEMLLFRSEVQLVDELYVLPGKVVDNLFDGAGIVLAEV